jgi:signal transduction histidine kinase
VRLFGLLSAVIGAHARAAESERIPEPPAAFVLSARADAAPVRLSSRGDVFVEGDLRLLEEALLNLVANGIEATPPGGEGS